MRFWTASMFIAFLFIHAAWRQTLAVVKYSKPDQGLTELDYSLIPSDVEEVKVNGNEISSISLPRDFPNMVKFLAYDNALVEFPDLTFVGDTLVTLRLLRNLISTVSQSRLSALTRLEDLNLAKNYISAFPDVTGAGPYHMQKLVLSDNPLLTTPLLPNLGRTVDYVALGGVDLGTTTMESILAAYPMLTFYGFIGNGMDNIPNFWHFPRREDNVPTTIRIGRNPIKKLGRHSLAALSNPNWHVEITRCEIETIPNLLDLSISAIVDLSENPLICDCRLKWLKVALNNTGIDTSTLICSQPPHLNQTAFDDVPVHELKCEESYRQTAVEQYDRSASPNPIPPVVRALIVPSLLQCASACVLDDHCLTFTTRPSGSWISCGLTDYREAGIVGVPPGIWGLGETIWYLIDV